MMTMMDELFDRTYQAGRSNLNSGIDQLFSRVSGTVLGAFRVGTRIQYHAPWSRRSSRTGCA